ncbi:Hsp20/alpha crystallin family protein [Stutzerimonas stutzeri]|uniref:Hsp20/alpha crystallin family protein n=1 Tax=Stutzerimonas sp. S1 TaxID=3030652 RepID=UPI00222587DF|nr:Hsp20/alpha crystallin family protein [Stutzerimonas sp. S1]MCW3148042.1 Hsp20/alpha crystallin family protein [Stutzerimonas sp. S1]
MTDTSNKPAASEGKEAGAQPPATHETWRPFETLRHQIDRLFDDFDRSWHRPARQGLETTPFWQGGLSRMPAVDVVEKDNAFEITAEVPGMDQKDIEVKLVGDTLVIKGEKRQERKEDKQGYHLSERSYGSFQRSFALPDGVDRDQIDAKFGKGVLSLTLPKKPGTSANEKNISIKTD